MTRTPIPFATLLLSAFALAACADDAVLPVAPPAVRLAADARPFDPGSVVPGSIAFVSTRTGRTELFAMNPGGQGVTQLTFSPVDEVRDNLRILWTQNRPAWSPDGSKLLFTRRALDLSVTPNAVIHDIHVLDLAEPDPRPRRLMNNPRASGGPAWSPDGQKVAYCSFNSGPATIYIFDLASGEMSPTSSGPACWPHWSPDGSTVAFHELAANNRLALLDVATGAVRYVTSHAPDNPAKDFVPRWSPDGQWLAFTSNRDKDAAGTRYWSIFLIRSDGSSTPRNLTPIPDGVTAGEWNNELPTWSNNGEHVYFHSRRPGSGGFTQVYRTDLEGTEVVRMTESAADSYQPDVRPVVRP